MTKEAKSACALLQLKETKMKDSQKQCGTEKKCRYFRTINIRKLDLSNKENLAFQEAISCAACGEECEEPVKENWIKCGKWSEWAYKLYELRKRCLIFMIMAYVLMRLCILFFKFQLLC
jgi:hypothetical protein